MPVRRAGEFGGMFAGLVAPAIAIGKASAIFNFCEVAYAATCWAITRLGIKIWPASFHTMTAATAPTTPSET